MWQHIGCVIIPEKPMEGNPSTVPEVFYCEICRLNRADPYVLPIFSYCKNCSIAALFINCELFV